MNPTSKPVKSFLAMCEGGECCTRLELREDAAVLTRETGERLVLPREEWDQIAAAVRDGRL